MESDQPKRESKLSLSKRLKRQRRALEQLQSNSVAAQPSEDSRFPIDEQPSGSSRSPIDEQSSGNSSSLITEQHSNSNSSITEQHSSIDDKEEDSSIDDGHSDSESSIDESKVPNAANPFLLKMMAELAAKRLVNFIVDNNEVLGIISGDATATNSKENISAHILGTSDFFQDRHSLKDIFHELLRFANIICQIMEDNRIDIRAFDTDDTFQKNVISLMARYL